MIKSLYVLELGITRWKVKIKMFYIDNLLRKKAFHLHENISRISFCYLRFFSKLNTGIFFSMGKWHGLCFAW